MIAAYAGSRSAQHVKEEFRRVSSLACESNNSTQTLRTAIAELQVLRNDMEALIDKNTDGELSIEQFWRGFCDVAVNDESGGPSDMRSAVAAFDSHVELLSKLAEYERWFSEPPQVDFARRTGIKITSKAEDLKEAIRRTQNYRHQIVERWPLTKLEFEYRFPVDVEEVLYIRPAAFLRSLVSIVWCAFRHPFSTTYVDLSTGDHITSQETMS